MLSKHLLFQTLHVSSCPHRDGRSSPAKMHLLSACWILLKASELNPNAPQDTVSEPQTIWWISGQPGLHDKASLGYMTSKPGLHDKANLGYMTRLTWSTWQYQLGLHEPVCLRSVTEDNCPLPAEPRKCPKVSCCSAAPGKSLSGPMAISDHPKYTEPMQW